MICWFVCLHVYLICMGVQMQRLFRDFGYIKGYSGEIFIGVTYFLFCGHIAKYFVMPTVIYLISTSDFTCSESLRTAF